MDDKSHDAGREHGFDPSIDSWTLPYSIVPPHNHDHHEPLDEATEVIQRHPAVNATEVEHNREHSEDSEDSGEEEEDDASEEGGESDQGHEGDQLHACETIPCRKPNYQAVDHAWWKVQSTLLAAAHG